VQCRAVRAGQGRVVWEKEKEARVCCACGACGLGCSACMHARAVTLIFFFGFWFCFFLARVRVPNQPKTDAETRGYCTTGGADRAHSSVAFALPCSLDPGFGSVSVRPCGCLLSPGGGSSSTPFESPSRNATLLSLAFFESILVLSLITGPGLALISLLPLPLPVPSRSERDPGETTLGCGGSGRVRKTNEGKKRHTVPTRKFV